MSMQDVLQRRYERERRARLEAEQLLEEKSAELYTTNLRLQSLAHRFQEQAERTQAIVDNAAEAIITIAEDGSIALVNPAAEQIFGYVASELIGSNFQRLIQPRKLEDVGSDSQATGTTVPWMIVGCHQLIGLRKDGVEICLELVSSQVKLNDGDFTTAIIRDVTLRKQLESQLAHAQKMESVGQLAAGIAHEINTPIQYVGDNTRFLEDAFQSIQELVGAFKDLESAVVESTSTEKALDRIRQLEQEADIEFICEEVPEAIKQSLDGAQRVAKIVRAMKEFSHPGGEEKQSIDLNRAIDSTITVSKNEWKYVAQMRTDFDSSLPLVSCYPSDLNQAILNMIVNSAHAIEAKNKTASPSPENMISISTKQIGETIEIRITDTGSGIPRELVSRIFDPFFTTKEVGKGTGQGLAIVYSVIVEKHNGSIDVESNAGKGTTFVIRLPLDEKFPDTGDQSDESEAAFC